jgi:hypothetical protein
MSLNAINKVAQDAEGNLMAGASVAIRQESDSALIVLWEDAAGTVGAGNPYTTADGVITLWAETNKVKITATLGSTVSIQRDVIIGMKAEYVDYGGGNAKTALDASLQTVATLAELLALDPADFNGEERRVTGIGIFKSNGTIWQPKETLDTLDMYGGDGGGAVDNQSAVVDWIAGADYPSLSYGTYNIEGATVTISGDVEGFGGTLVHVGDESGANVTDFILNGGKLINVNLTGTGRSSLLDMRGDRDAVHSSRLDNQATGVASGRGVLLNSTADHQSVIGNYINAEKFALLSQEDHTGIGLLVLGNYGISPNGVSFNYNHPFKTLKGLIHCANYHGSSIADSGNVELGMAVAGTQGGVLGISYISSPLDDAIHLEDGHRNIVIDGVVAENCAGKGINSLATGQEQEVGDSPVFNAISMRGNGTTADIGINAPVSVDNTQIDGTIFNAIVAEDFITYGAQLGDATFFLDNATLKGCATGVHVTNRGRQIGSVFTDAGILAEVGNRVIADKIYAPSAPTDITIDDAGATYPRGAIKGFGYPLAFTHTGGGAEVLPLTGFKLRLNTIVKGQIYVTFGGNGGTRGGYTADISWSGNTLTVTNPHSYGTGFTAISCVLDTTGVTYAVLALSITSGVATVDDIAVIDFNGIYVAGGTTPTAWVTSTVYAIGVYKTNAGNLYRAATAGTSGATAPTHSSGTVSDGGVDWLFIW